MHIALDHIGILTRAIDESVDFYTSRLGMEICPHAPVAGTFECVCLSDGSPSTRVLLYLIGPPFSPWMKAFIARHGPMLAYLGFEVDDVNKWQNMLQAEKIEFVTPREEFEGAIQFFVHDPAGIVLKFQSQRTPDDTKSITSDSSSDRSPKFRLSHTNITCEEIPTLMSFYTNTLRMKIVLDARDEGMIFLADPIALADENYDIFPLEIFGPPALWDMDLEFLEKHGAGLQYLCFAVDDVDEAYRDLNLEGVDFHLPPTDFEDNRVAFFKDPNGIDIEILHPLPQNVLRGSQND